MVALRAASGDKGVAVLGQGRGDDVFKLADLVSSKAKTGGAVLPLGPDLGFGGSGLGVAGVAGLGFPLAGFGGGSGFWGEGLST